MGFHRRLACLSMGLAALVGASEAAVAAPEELERRDLLIDGDFVGPLPPPIIDRGGTVWDEHVGGPIDRTGPVFDAPRGGGVATPWVPCGDPINVASAIMSGWSRDQAEPRVAIFDRQRGELTIWHGDDLSAPPTHRLAMRRDWDGGVTVDALQGTAFERPDATHRIASGVMLPGLLLVLLERIEWTEGPDGLRSGYAGVTIAALQETVDGGWDWTLAEDVANEAPPEAADHGRGYVSSMAAYYPVERTADFTTAFVPFVDYLNHLSNRKAMGGQCGLLRVRRAAVGDAWTIDPIVEIASSWGAEGEHYHVAGWTPDGVAVGIGDSEFNRVALLRCADWDRYDDPSQWTIVPRWQGDTADGAPILANQFWACCAGNHPSTLLVGGDNVSASIYSLTIPPPGDDVAPETPRVLGDQSGTLFEGSSANTASWLQRDRPETGGPIVARWVCEGGGYPQFSRTIYSPDGEHFATVARLPRGFERLALPFLVGDRLHIHRQTGAGEPGLMRCTPPREVPTQRGLLVRPAGLDLLRDSLGRHRAPASISAASGVEVTVVDPATVIESTGWHPGPDAVCYRVRGEGSGSSGALLSAAFANDGPEAPDASSLGLHMRVCNLLPGKLLLRTLLDRDGQTTKKSFHIASTGDWNDCDAWSLISSAPYDCAVELQNGAGSARPTVDFLVIFRSLTASTGPPAWMLDPVVDGLVPGDRVDFPTPVRSDEWAVEVELQIPPEGGDFSVGSRMGIVPICTWRFAGGGHVSLSHRLGGGEYRIDLGGLTGTVEDIEPLHLVRGDTIVARLARRDGELRLTLQSAGSVDPAVATRVLPLVPRRGPTALRIGGPEHELISALVIRRVTVESPSVHGPRDLTPEDPPVADGPARRGMPGDDRGGSVSLFEIASRLGSVGADLPRRVDLDGDGAVTVLDLEAAIRVIRASVTPNRPPARDR